MDADGFGKVTRDSRKPGIARPLVVHQTEWVAVMVSVLVLLAVPCAARPRPPAQATKGVEILLLGTAGGPRLWKDYSETSTLLIVDGRKYLIDCGIGTVRRMVRAGIDSQDVRTIFFTHLHPDHALGLADVMANDSFNMDFNGPAHAINIYGPPETREFVQAALEYLRIPFGIFAAEKLPGTLVAGKFVAHNITKAGEVYQDDKVWVVAAENSHYVLLPAQDRARMKSFAYRFETPEGAVVFTGDTGPSDAVTQLARGADVLISEASDGDPAATVQWVNKTATEHHWTPERRQRFLAHMEREHLDLEEIGKMAARAQVKAVILYHYNPDDGAAYVAGVKKYFAGPVFAGADFERYCLGAHVGKATSAVTIRPCR
jgi:ribonuclease BN (tRNA processing enzyme)